MKKSYGDFIDVEIYGESHSDEIGVVIKGLPEGAVFDPEELSRFMARRAPGQGQGAYSMASTPRREKDIVHFPEGVEVLSDGRLRATGAAVRACIYNEDRRSRDYDELRKVLRPGHADLGAYLRDGKEGLRPGGGRFSGRMTAPLSIAGGILLQLLQAKGISVHASILEIAGERGEDAIREAIRLAASEGDSVGGIVECVISGFPVGIGGALFEGLEGAIAEAVFAIPAVKGIEFGAGFESSRLRGSENNDPIFLGPSGELRTEGNRAGGINGGISNGMEIVFRVALKPTPTISRPQRTVNIDTMEETILQAGGRHDVCIVPRAVPVVEAAAALALGDALLGKGRLL